MTEGDFGGLWTLVALIAFLSVCAWAYSGRRKKDFDEAANLPFADEFELDQREKVRQENVAP